MRHSIARGASLIALVALAGTASAETGSRDAARAAGAER